MSVSLVSASLPMVRPNQTPASRPAPPPAPPPEVNEGHDGDGDDGGTTAASPQGVYGEF